MRKRREWRRLAEFAPEDVLPYAGPTSTPKYYADLQGREWPVKMCSHRYGTFQTSLSCACCGITGSVMILEYQLRGNMGDPEFKKPHFNLYAVTQDGLILMTKDHIVPRSEGGEDILSNYQTMCVLCNSLKGSDQVDMEVVRERRKQYDEQPRSPKGKNSPATVDLITCITDEHKAAFWANIQKSDDCWLWVGSLYKRGCPYFTIRRRHGVHSISFASRSGKARRRKKGIDAFRAAYYLTMGEFPQRGVWQVACRNRLCCNPAHMGMELEFRRHAAQRTVS